MAVSRLLHAVLLTTILAQCFAKPPYLPPGVRRHGRPIGRAPVQPRPGVTEPLAGPLTEESKVPKDPSKAAAVAAISKTGLQFNYQLSEPWKYPDSVIPGVKVYFMDLVTDEVDVRKARAAGLYPICYFSVGASEPWRNDASKFRSKDLGNPIKSYKGEYYLNIRSHNVRNIMEKRIKLCASKGFVGTISDNTDFYTLDAYPEWQDPDYIQTTGFNLTTDDIVDYITFLSKEIRGSGMGMGLLNTQLVIPRVLNKVNYFVNEQCWDYEEDCLLYVTGGVKAANKPVYQINYNSTMFFDTVCSEYEQYGFTPILKRLNLDNFWADCTP